MKKLLEADPPDTNHQALQRRTEEFAKSYGGDPRDSRQRLDALIEGKPKYWQRR